MHSPRILQYFIRVLAFVVLIFMFCMCSPVVPQVAQTQEDNFDFEGLQRTYTLYTPSSYDGTRALPLVIALHGGKGNSERMSDLTHLSQLGEQEGFFVVYPNGYENRWADGRGTTPADKAGINDVGFISTLIDRLLGEYKIIPQQVYVTGISNGGHMAYRLACELSQKIAAVAPVAANVVQNIVASCDPKRPVPVLQLHGTEDPFGPYLGGEVNGGGFTLSAEASVAFWASRNGCLAEPSSENLPDTVQDGTTVTVSSYQSCQQDADVQLYTIVGGGHTWPGGLQYLPERIIGKTSRDIDANEIIWMFFKEHPKPTP
jgi:polyhydroxybutyrate depolymerase